MAARRAAAAAAALAAEEEEALPPPLSPLSPPPPTPPKPSSVFDRREEEEEEEEIYLPSPAADHVRALEREAAALAEREAATRRELARLAGAKAAAAEAAAAAAAHRNGGPPAPAHGPPLPVDVRGLAAELSALRGAAAYASSLQELAGLARHLERCVRTVERGAAAMATASGAGERSSSPSSSSSPAGGSAAAVLAAAPDAVAAAAAAGAGALAVARLPPAGVPAALVAHAATALARSAGAQRRLEGSLRACLRASAAAVGWPPPIVSEGDSSSWDGGFAVRPEAADEACRLVAALTALQRASMAREFDAAERASCCASSGASSPSPLPPPSETPLLWAASELAAVVVEQRVAPLFLGGGEENDGDRENADGAADAPERPEWLFEAAARAAGAAGAAAAPLQPGIDAHYEAVLRRGSGAGIGTGGAEDSSSNRVEGCCRSLPAEVARAVRDELWAQVLTKRVLPRLSGLRSRALWSHFVSEAVAFERRLAVARGLGAGSDGEDGGGGGEGSGAVVDAAWPDADGGVLSRLCSSSLPVSEWRDSWWECDREAGVRAVEDAAGSGKGGEWHAAAGAAVAAAAARAEDEAALGGGFGSIGGGGGTPAAAVVLPSSLEFAPPPAAEAAARALVEAASRVAWLPSWSPAASSAAAENGDRKKKKKKALFLRTPALARPRYVDAAARPVLAAFRSRASRAAEAAARFGDPLADATRAAVVGGVASGSRWLEHELREGGWPLLLLDEGCSPGSSSPPPPAASGTGSETGSGGDRRKPRAPPPRPSVLAAEADALAALSRKWTTRLAKSAADAFERAAGPAVERAVRGDAFVLSSSPDAGADDESASYFVASGPSPALAPALAALAAALAAAARALDAVAFRSVWRGAAAAATRLLFNEVATEARFDGAGGRQLGADAAALAAVLAPYAPRNPGAHVRELTEAAALLALPSAAAAALGAAVATRGGGGGGEGAEGALASAVAALRSVGVSRLSPDQAAAVLSRRVF